MRRNCERCGATQNIKDGKRTTITAIIRTKDVCNKCFDVIKKDNGKLSRNGQNIPNSVVTLDDLEDMQETRDKLRRGR